MHTHRKEKLEEYKRAESVTKKKFIVKMPWFIRIVFFFFSSSSSSFFSFVFNVNINSVFHTRSYLYVFDLIFEFGRRWPGDSMWKFHENKKMLEFQLKCSVVNVNLPMLAIGAQLFKVLYKTKHLKTNGKEKPQA